MPPNLTFQGRDNGFSDTVREEDSEERQAEAACGVALCSRARRRGVSGVGGLRWFARTAAEDRAVRERRELQQGGDHPRRRGNTIGATHSNGAFVVSREQEQLRPLRCELQLRRVGKVAEHLRPMARAPRAPGPDLQAIPETYNQSTVCSQPGATHPVRRFTISSGTTVGDLLLHGQRSRSGREQRQCDGDVGRTERSPAQRQQPQPDTRLPVTCSPTKPTRRSGTPG